MYKILFAACLVAATLPGCQATPNPGEVGATDVIACPQERPEVCTQQYDPVCGVTAPGEHQTYSNACSACADDRVGGYLPGPCEKKP